jgi:hypothetical protein
MDDIPLKLGNAAKHIMEPEVSKFPAVDESFLGGGHFSGSGGMGIMGRIGLMGLMGTEAWTKWTS